MIVVNGSGWVVMVDIDSDDSDIDVVDHVELIKR